MDRRTRVDRLFAIEIRRVEVQKEIAIHARERGIWGHAPKRDANVFFGKYISSRRSEDSGVARMSWGA